MVLGFFDGVHLGHRKVISAARKIAEKKKLKLAVMTFFPHPKEVSGNGNTKMNYLTPVNVKLEIFSELGVEKVYVIHFTKSFAALTPREFIQKYLITLGAEHVVAGFDFTYGYKGKGNMETVHADGDGSFLVTSIPKIEQNGRKISSTLIRELLKKGEVQKVAECLGNYYETRGRILPFSRVIVAGVFKAEVIPAPYFTLPKEGTYEVEAQIAQRIFQGTAYVRTSKSLTLEINQFHQLMQVEDLKITIKWMEQSIKNKQIKRFANY
jgi:riboflavin kinase/FMN adenylyltransferase